MTSLRRASAATVRTGVRLRLRSTRLRMPRADTRKWQPCHYPPGSPANRGHPPSGTAASPMRQSCIPMRFSSLSRPPTRRLRSERSAVRIGPGAWWECLRIGWFARRAQVGHRACWGSMTQTMAQTPRAMARKGHCGPGARRRAHRSAGQRRGYGRQPDVNSQLAPSAQKRRLGR